MMKSRKILDIAIGEIGVKEIAGSKHNPRVIEYHSVTSLHATTDEVPWCSSFVNWCVVQSGKEPTRSAMAASWKRWGKRLNKPKKGCIIGFIRPDGSGHVGFFLEEIPGKYRIVGGNQDNEVNVSSWNKANREWFFVEPKTFVNSKTARAGAGASAGSAVLAAPAVLDMLNQIRQDTKEAREGVTSITESLAGMDSKPSFLQEWSPLIVLALSLFIIYDRLMKERAK